MARSQPLVTQLGMTALHWATQYKPLLCICILIPYSAFYRCCYMESCVDWSGVKLSFFWGWIGCCRCLKILELKEE